MSCIKKSTRVYNLCARIYRQLYQKHVVTTHLTVNNEEKQTRYTRQWIIF